MASQAVTARDVRILYTGKRVHVACWDVSLEVHNGEFVALVGPSGCGKTSFLLACGNLIPVASGTLVVQNEASIVFQDASLLPWRNVVKNVEYGLELRGVPRQERREHALRMLELVGLQDYPDSYPHTLSGGMKQRVNLARALATDSPILLCDEPFGALDAQTREEMQAELAVLLDQARKTCLFVTHDISEAVYLSDRVVLFSGRPGTVIDVVDIDLPRPRGQDIKQSALFQEYCHRLWSGLKKSDQG